MTPQPESTRETRPLEADIALARVVARIVRDTKGVADLSAGRFADAMTYGRGESVRGVVVTDDSVRVHIIASYPEGFPIPAMAGRLRARLGEHTHDRVIDIVVDDMTEERQ